MNYEEQSELIPTNEITPFDSEEEISFKLKQKYYESKKQFVNQKQCERCLAGYPDKFCPNYLKCPYVEKNTANTIVNKFKDFTEVIFYKKNFYVPKGTKVSDKVDKTRKWIKTENGVLVPKNDDVLLEDLARTITGSRNRALDNMYGFVLCNDWQYFVTITFKHGKDKKLSDDVVKHQWKKFREQLQYRFPDIKIFLAIEDSPTGVKGMHFHGFMGNAELGRYLIPARNNKKMYKGKPNPQYGEFLYTKFGDPIFNFLPSFVNVGYTTVVKIKDCNQLKLVNYMTKYMHKGSSTFDYNENSYLRTYNLNFKEKEVCKFSTAEKNQLVNSLFAQQYKDTKEMTVYRIYNNIN